MLYPEITVDRGDNEHFAHSQTGVPSTQNSRGAGFPRSFEMHALAVVCLIYSKKQKSTRWSVITWEINLSSKKLGKGCGFPCVAASFDRRAQDLFLPPALRPLLRPLSTQMFFIHTAGLSPPHPQPPQAVFCLPS